MIPQDKAAHLYSRFMNYTDTTCNTERDNIKKCCLIAVDEITKEAFNVFGSLERYDYWQQVKEEINKL